MLAYPSMIAEAARRAGMEVPPDPDDFDKAKYPHFHVFCEVQLCRATFPDEPHHNARVIAALSRDEVTTLTLRQFIDRGLRYING